MGAGAGDGNGVSGGVQGASGGAAKGIGGAEQAGDVLAPDVLAGGVALYDFVEVGKLYGRVSLPPGVSAVPAGVCAPGRG